MKLKECQEKKTHKRLRVNAMKFAMPRIPRGCCGTRLLVLFALAIFLLVLCFGKILLPDRPRSVPLHSRLPVVPTDRDMANKKIKNVILLTHMRSGSTFIGNVFNLHPEVFYLYEPLHDLRRKGYGNEWQFLEKEQNGAYIADFSKLLRDSFSCSFQEKSTRDLIFAPWIRPLRRYMSWRLSTPLVTQQALNEACEKRKITVAKIMQTRLPREIGIRELQRVCSSEPGTFDCLIIHLVRDPRAVLSSLMGRKFFLKGETRKRFVSSNEDAMQMIRQHAFVLCSELEDNLNFVKRMPHWFEGRYKLIRYEDVLRNVTKTVYDLYDFAGIPMVNSIRKWIHEGASSTKAKPGAFSAPKSSDQSNAHWRFEKEPAVVSAFEESCRSLMELLGYLPIDGSEDLQHDPDRELCTENIPFLGR